MPKRKWALVVIIHAARFLPHQARKQGVDEIENPLVAAEIFRERNDARAGIGHPSLMIFGEDARIGQAETVNALLDIADEETVGAIALAAQRFNDRLLGFIDVLVFIHEYEAQFLAPMTGNLARTAVFPKQAKGKLFKVVKVDAAFLPFGFAKCGVKLPGEIEQRQHGRTGPKPILHQRFHPACHAHRTQKIRLVKHFFDRPAPGALGPGPIRVRLPDGFESGGELGALGFFRQGGEGLGALGGIFVRRRLGLQNGQPGFPPVRQFVHQPTKPESGFALLKTRGLLREPGVRIAQGLRIMVQTQNQLAHWQVPIPALRLDELLNGQGGQAVVGIGFVQDKVQALPFQ